MGDRYSLAIVSISKRLDCKLVSRIQEMRKQLPEYHAEFSADPPEDLTVDQTNQALTQEGSSQVDNPVIINDWKTLRRNLAFANAALSMANAEQFVDGDHHKGGDNVLD